jgi:hypothetical protein
VNGKDLEPAILPDLQPPLAVLDHQVEQALGRHDVREQDLPSTHHFRQPAVSLITIS